MPGPRPSSSTPRPGQARPSRFRQALDLTCALECVKRRDAPHLRPADHRKRFVSRHLIGSERSDADEADAAIFGVERDQGQQVADFMALEQIAEIEQRNAELLKDAGNAGEREVRASEDGLLAVRHALRAKPLMLSRMASASAARVGATVSDTSPPSPRLAVHVPAIAAAAHGGGKSCKSAHDRSEGSIVGAKGMARAAELLLEACDIGRFGSAKAVDRLPLVGNDPNVGAGAADDARATERSPGSRPGIHRPRCV